MAEVAHRRSRPGSPRGAARAPLWRGARPCPTRRRRAGSSPTSPASTSTPTSRRAATVEALERRRRRRAAVVMPLRRAAEQLGELRARAARLAGPGRGPVRRPQRGRLARRRARLRAPRRAARASRSEIEVQSTPTAPALDWRTLIVLEEGAEAEVWERYALRRATRSRGCFNAVVELERRPRRRRCATSASRSSPSRPGSSPPSAPRSSATPRLDWVGARLRLGPRQGADGDQARRPGLRGHASPAPTPAAAGQHLDFDTTQEHAAPRHDLRPRLPRRPRRPARPRSGAG